MVHKRIWFILGTIMLASGLIMGLTAGFAYSPPPPLRGTQTTAQTGLVELLPTADYTAWYEQATGYTSDPHYFGAYKLEPNGDQLYVGFGTGRPAEFDGSLLAVTDGDVLTAVAPLDEQGFIDMQLANDTLFIPGADPCCGDGWNLGNFYVKQPGQSLTKYRNLPNVIHSWGTWYDTDSDILYAAVSAHLGDNTTLTGEIFSSTNQAADWSRVGNYIDGLGNYRTYDVIGFADKLYAVWSDDYAVSTNQYYACGLTVSEDGGLNWTRITTTTSQPITCRSRLHVWNNQLLALSHDRKSFLAIDGDNHITQYPLTDYRVTSWAYNALASDQEGYLYTLADYGQIIRTKDLINWELMAYANRDLFTIAYWPDKNWLVVGERGNGRLWKLDLATAQPTTPGLQSAKYTILMVADGWGANHIAAANGYTDNTPVYQRWPRYWISTYPANSGYDPTLAWSDFNYPLTGYTDSAAAATALYTGQKTSNGRISVNITATQRLRTLSEIAQGLNKATGAVSSVQISHATPGAWMGHNDARGNGFDIADEGLWGDPNTTGTITDSTRYGGGHGPTLPPQDVVIGGGHPAWQTSSYVNISMRDLLAVNSGEPDEFVFIERFTGQANGGERLLYAANYSTTTRLMGLFGGTGGNIEYRLADGSGHNPENPTLAEMTESALIVLNRNPEGFALMVEGGAVDWASHANNMDRMVGEMIGFNAAVQTVIDWVDDPTNGSNWSNTLIIITGDHETGYLTTAPNTFADMPLGVVNADTLALEKVVESNGRRASWQDTNNNNEIDEGETVYWAWNSGGHSNSLIPLYARGVGATQIAHYANGHDPVRGAYLDNTDVFRLFNHVLNEPYTLYLPIILLGSSDNRIIE